MLRRFEKLAPRCRLLWNSCMYAPPLVDRLLPYDPYSVCLRDPTEPVRVLDDAFTVRLPMEPHLRPREMDKRETN